MARCPQQDLRTGRETRAATQYTAHRCHRMTGRHDSRCGSPSQPHLGTRLVDSQSRRSKAGSGARRTSMTCPRCASGSPCMGHLLPWMLHSCRHRTGEADRQGFLPDPRKKGPGGSGNVRAGSRRGDEGRGVPGSRDGKVANAIMREDPEEP